MRNKKLFIAGLVLLFFGLIFYGCENGGAGEPSQDVLNAVKAVFTPISDIMSQDLEGIEFPYELPSGITVGYDGESTLTVTFKNYYNESTGYTINGTITLTMTISSDNTTITIAATGMVTLTGGSVSELVFDIKMSGDYDDVEDDFAGEPTPSGTITADGTEYDFADFSSLFEDEDGGDEVPVTLNPHFIVACNSLEDPLRILPALEHITVSLHIQKTAHHGGIRTYHRFHPLQPTFTVSQATAAATVLRSERAARYSIQQTG